MLFSLWYVEFTKFVSSFRNLLNLWVLCCIFIPFDEIMLHE